METNFGTIPMEMRLEPVGSDCPANFIEMLRARNRFNLDVVSIKDSIGWSKSDNTLYVWDFKGRGPARQLHLTSAESQDNARLYLAFKDTDHVSAMALNIEGSVRWWPSVNVQHHVDTKISGELQGEVPIGLHLIRKSTKTSPPLFGIVTSTGTALTMKLNANGTFETKRMVDKGEKRRSFALFSLPKSKSTDYMLSTHVRLPKKRGEAERDVFVAIAKDHLKAIDITKNVDLWRVQASDLGEQLSQKIQAQGVVQAKVVVEFIDAKAYQDGIMALVSAHGEFSQNPHFLLVKIQGIDDKTPVFASTNRVNLSLEMFHRMRVFEVENYRRTPNNIRLVIPETTATTEKLATTDGILLVHDTFIHSVFPIMVNHRPNAFQLTSVAGRNGIIGYGCDASSLCIIDNQGAANFVRILPQAFPPSRHQPIIANAIRDLHWPDRQVESALLRALLAFANKEMADAAFISEEQLVGVTSPSSLLVVIRYTLWTVCADLDASSSDFLAEVRQKTRFYHFFVLFLKYFGILEKIVDVDFQHPLTGKISKGSEAITEVLERLRVAESLNEWARLQKTLVGENLTDEEEFLMDLVRKVPEIQGQVDHWRLLEHQHRLPVVALVAVAEVSQNMQSYAKVEFIYQALFLFGDYFKSFAEGIRLARNSIQWLRKEHGLERWTTEIYALLPKLCISFVDKADNPVFSNEIKKTFLRYIIDLTSIELREAALPPQNHPVLLKLIKKGHAPEALHLAEEFRDFPVLCQLLLTYEEEDRRIVIDDYKVQFAAEDFEGHYLNYLVEHGKMNVLLKERSQRADEFIANIDRVSWIRNVENGDMKQASANLVQEARKEKECFKKKQYMVALGLLATMADETKDDQKAVREILFSFGVRKAHFQERIPREFLQLIYPGQEMENAFDVGELHEIAKMIIEDEKCTAERFMDVVAYGAAIKAVRDRIPERTRGLFVYAWQKAIEKDDWMRMNAVTLNDTLLAKIVKKLFEEDAEIACAAIPSADLLSRISPDIQNSPCWDTICELLVEAKDAATNWLKTGIPPV